MKILSTNVYVGSNVYARFPVIRHTIDLGILEAYPTGHLGEEFIAGLLSALPGLREHHCSYGEPGGFVRRLTEGEGTWMGHVWEHVTLELQRLAGSDVAFGKTRSAGKEGQYHMVYEYAHREVGLDACLLGRDLLVHLLPDAVRAELDTEAFGMHGRDVGVDLGGEEGFDFEARREAFIRHAQRYQLGPSTSALVEAAQARDVPTLRLNTGSLVQLGHGAYQRRLQATITSETRHIAVELAGDKEATQRLLGDLGLPVPRQRAAGSEDEAVEAAEAVGYPVVVKPIDANHGRGVSINLTTAGQVRTATEEAKQHSATVLVEQFIDGVDHRLLVVGNRLVAAARRIPGHVVGDGRRSIAALVGEVNRDPRRGVGHEKPLTRLALDEQAKRLMREKGYTENTVLTDGEVFYLRTTANLSTGGMAIDVTDAVHPDNRDMAVRAVQAIGLDVGGVDFLTGDVTQSYRDVGGAIVEVNAAPGFRMHVAPSEGAPRDVAGPVIDMLFPPGTPSRIPIAAITGTNGKTTTARMLAHILKSAGRVVGLTTTDGVYVDGRLTVSGDMTGPVSARMVLRDPSVDTAVLETARGGLLRSGLGFERCDVGACLNVTADHLGLGGIETLDELADVKSLVVEAARGMAVLNADDPQCRRMADRAERAEHLCYVTTGPEQERVREHVRAGGRAVVLERGEDGDMITLFDNGASLPLLQTHQVPATLEGRAGHNVQNAMFAAALAYGMGLSLEAIRHGLRTFTTSFFQAPGRLNLYDEHPFRVILDYAHNPAAVRATGEFADRLEVKGLRRCVLGVPGDRRDEDVRAVAQAAATHFDVFICKEDDDRRGRPPGQAPQMLRQALLEAGIPGEQIEIIGNEEEAVQQGLASAEAGDLLVIFGDDVGRCWKQIAGVSPPKDRRRISAEPGTGQPVNARAVKRKDH